MSGGVGGGRSIKFDLKISSNLIGSTSSDASKEKPHAKSSWSNSFREKTRRLGVMGLKWEWTSVESVFSVTRYLYQYFQKWTIVNNICFTSWRKSSDYVFPFMTKTKQNKTAKTHRIKVGLVEEREKKQTTQNRVSVNLVASFYFSWGKKKLNSLTFWKGWTDGNGPKTHLWAVAKKKRVNF